MKIRHIALLAGFLFVLGCAGGPGAGSTVTIDTSSGKSQTGKQSFLFSNKIKVGEIRYRKAGDLNQAQVDLISQSGSVVPLEVKGVWQDQSGFVVPDPKELWRQIIMNPRETKSIIFTAPRQDAVILQLTAREGNLEGN
jgi:uncharacterized protein YcfL